MEKGLKMLMASAIVSLIGALLLTFVVLHPRINEGLTIKTGLILMIFSLLTTFALVAVEQSRSPEAFLAAAFILRLGVVITAVGILMWAHRRAKIHRAITGKQRTNAKMNPLAWMAEDLAEAFKAEDRARVD